MCLWSVPLEMFTQPVSFALIFFLLFKSIKSLWLFPFQEDFILMMLAMWPLAAKCPNGSFVPFDKTPGTRKQDCKSCPEGNISYFSRYGSQLKNKQTN